MANVFVFPGQGSQYKGMGEELFSKYPERVREADEVLGYSIVDLCLNDPEGVLNQTEFTQPAIYTVNALAYFDAIEQGLRADYLAGHSLGEFNALLAAGAYDFKTGLRLVQKRGEIMSQVKGGSMAAMLGFGQKKIQQYIDEHELASIGFANFNAGDQIIVSGSEVDLEKFESVIDENDGRFIRLNVSAAFHSKFMDQPKEEFQQFIESENFEFLPLTTPVLSNWSGDPYPSENYQSNIVNQLNHPVKWYQSMSTLLHCCGRLKFEELGPGFVLTRMCQKIVDDPMAIKSDELLPVWQEIYEEHQKVKNLFMFSGQGSQYYQMGKQLFEQNPTFKEEMEQCDALFLSLTGQSLIEKLYVNHQRSEEFSEVQFTHPAIFCFGYCLAKTVQAEGVQPDAVLGYSLGEFVAAVVAGALSLEEALTAIVTQANLLKSQADNGAMLTVLAPADHFEQHAELYQGAEFASLNYDGNFVVSGERHQLEKVQAKLKAKDILTVMLPVNHGFHSNQIGHIESDFLESFNDVKFQTTAMPVYSAATKDEVATPDAKHLWKATREAVYFSEAIQSLRELGDWRFIDLSATGTLSTFIKYAFKSEDHYTAASPYGNDVEALGRLVKEVAPA